MRQTYFNEYLSVVANPDTISKIVKLEFLNKDGTVAFTIDNQYKRGYGGNSSGSRAFLQEGNLSVSLQNGKRRQASVTFENLDGAFDYNINHIWDGQLIKLQMGVRLSDGYDYYIPQGVFYVDSPQIEWRPNSRRATYNLVDKWAYLDGSLFGKLNETYEVPAGYNIFSAMSSILSLSRYTLQSTTNRLQMIDPIPPLYTTFYKGKTVTVNGEVYTLDQAPYAILTEYGKSCADAILQLNSIVAGWIGYDTNGRLTVLPSENDISDAKKPVLWDFTTKSKTFLGLSEAIKIGEVCNEYNIVGEALDSTVAPVGRAINTDTSSDTSIYVIGRRPQFESESGYYTKEQCAALAVFRLKRATVLQKSVTISSSQLFHLQENNLLTVQRSDKPGAPIERHLIQAFSLPLSQTGQMSITATSVNDFPKITVEALSYGQ